MSGDAARPSSGVITFLFTDIEGSTRRWEADPEAMRIALESHDAALRTAIIDCGGEVFKHTGDGLCAVFNSPRAAVDAAVAAQRILDLPVRMGIATGEAEQRAGDYFGAVLNRTARLMAAGHGGQILLDGQTAGLVDGAELVTLGPRRLRGIANPVDVFQVQSPGLRMEFPPLRTADTVPGNLRPPTSSFVGRKNELADLEAALEAYRLVTLIGVGGVGKTRLALEAAGRMADGFPDGVWVIELASIEDPAAVPDVVGTVLGITQQSGMSVAESVAQALEGRTRLLVFDNCEHVLDAAADMIETILARSPTMRIMATSREGLRLADEQLFPVPSLDVSSSAATLFVERAKAVAPAVSLTGHTDTVAEICRRLDGMPLAIELAASRMQSITVAEIRDRLDDRFRLLVGSRRGLERHQTLRHAVQWSYDLLDDDEKSLLATCSVFSGGFDLHAASAVASEDDEFTTLDLLDALTRKSLLLADRSSERTRFSMLETIRQFAEEQLVSRGEAERARDAHARYFAECEDEVLALWNGPRQRAAYDWFTLELANLRSAFRWATDREGLDTAAAIAIYASTLGYWVQQLEPIAWAEELIEAAHGVGHPRLAQLYSTAAHCYMAGRRDDFFKYAALGETAMATERFDTVPDQFEASIASGYIATGDPERCVKWCRTVIARRTDRCTYTRLCLVIALTISGARDEAMVAAEDLLASADSSDNPRDTAFGLLARGWAYGPSDPTAAYEALRRSLTITQETGNRQLEVGIAIPLARLAAIHGDPASAFDFLTMAIRHYYDSGSFVVLPTPLAILAAFLDRLERYEPAATIFGFAGNTLMRSAFPEINAAIAHLRRVLGDNAYDELARAGASLTPATVATYAFEQIDRARAAIQ
jgi:predicted ATPase/class 3 adenylate cyclase